MKKFFKRITISICVLALIMSNARNLLEIQASSVKLFSYSAIQNLKSITLKWEKQENVSYYKIFRINSTKDYYLGITPKEKQYKEIAKVSQDKTQYVDKKVKKVNKYCYIIKGYEKKNGKDKLICSTFADYIYLCYTPGLDRPSFGPSSFIENYSFPLSKICFSVNPGDGMKPTGYIIYRKKVGKKSYKRVKLKKLAKGEYLDKKVAPGSFYKYKVKSYLRIGKKKYYSKMSSVLTLDTIRHIGKYNVKLLTPKKINTSTLSFKVTSKNKYNGNARFLPSYAGYYYQSSKKSNEIRYDLKLDKYSFDNKIWKKISKKGIVLKAKHTIYLQGTLYKDNLTKPTTIKFEEEKPYTSYIGFGDSLKYKDSKYYTEAAFDFVKGTGEAHQEGD